jgi:hypothetical protein
VILPQVGDLRQSHVQEPIMPSMSKTFSSSPEPAQEELQACSRLAEPFAWNDIVVHRNEHYQLFNRKQAFVMSMTR